MSILIKSAATERLPSGRPRNESEKNERFSLSWAAFEDSENSLERKIQRPLSHVTGCRFHIIFP